MTGSLSSVLDALNFEQAEYLSICHTPPGGAFRSSVQPANGVAAVLAALPAGSDTWFSVNPVAGPARDGGGRGTAEDVTRLAAVFADLDVKPGGLASLETASHVVDALSDLLGSRPVAQIFSGHGLQPVWAVDPDDDVDLADGARRQDAKTLLRRFGRLVASVADRYDGHVDSVFDLSRVLRCPGTINHKDPARRVAVLTLLEGGAPLSLRELRDALDAAGVPTLAEDSEQLGEVVLAPQDWPKATRTCHYVKQMVAAWATDSPTARHPWLTSQAVRLAAARRLGCVTDEDVVVAVKVLRDRFTHVLAQGTPSRKPTPGEVAHALSWGMARASTMETQRARRELGDHTHLDGKTAAPPPTTPPAAAPLRAAVAASQTPSHGSLALVPPLAAEAPVEVASETLERSEDGHAHQLIAAYGHLIRYCAERGRWLVWDGAVWRWQPEDGGQVREYAKVVARGFEQDDGGALSHKRKSLSAAGTSGALRQARTDSRIAVAINDLDADPWALNTPGGIVDLRTGAVRPCDPNGLHTRITAVTPDPNATDATWEAFLDGTFGEDVALRQYVQRLMGVALIGTVLEQVLPFLFGSGANGKSTLLEALLHVLRTGENGYALAAPAEMLMVRKHSEHPAELAQLAGARLVVCSELEDGQRLAEARVKQLTGRDSINARFLYGQPFTFTPSHTIVLAGNHKPVARVGGPAIWRRIKAIPFSRTVPKERRDSELGDKLAAAGAVVLAWAVQGAVEYRQHGLVDPPAVSEATKDYEADQDTVGRFVADSCHLAEGSTQVRAWRDQLRHAYESWCADTGDEPVTPKRFITELRDRFGVGEGKARGRRYISGIALLNTEDEDDSADGEWR